VINQSALKPTKAAPVNGSRVERLVAERLVVAAVVVVAWRRQNLWRGFIGVAGGGFCWGERYSPQLTESVGLVPLTASGLIYREAIATVTCDLQFHWLL